MIIDTKEIYTTETICEATGVKPSTLRVWVCRGKIRPLVVLDGKLTLWSKSQVAEIQELANNPTYGRPRKRDAA